jgi:hypothetical protein
MYSKIQPQQIEIHDFSSPSGHVNFVKGSNYVYANLSPTISGNFNFVGDVTVNGKSIPTINSSNTFDQEYNTVVGGSGNTVVGTGNSILNGDESYIFGNQNVIVNGYDCSFASGSRKNTIVGGNLCSVSAVTGVTILQDQSSIVVSANKNNALYVSFTGGSYVSSNVYMNGDVFFEPTRDLFLSASSSGVFSGDINVGGNLYWKGLLVPTMAQLTGASGQLSSRIISTGSSLDSKINTLSGSVSPLLTGAVRTTGNQTISGDKTFADDIFMRGSSIIGSTGTSANYVQLSESNAAPQGNLLKIVSRNSAAILFDAFETATEFSNLISGDSDLDTCFIVGTDSESVATCNEKLVVDSFGNTKIGGTLIAEGIGAYVPSDENDANGPNGLITQTGSYLYIKQNNNWSKFKASDWEEKTGEIWLDGYNTNISWVDGKIQNNGRVDIFSTGAGGSGGFSGNGVAGNLTLNGETALAWSNGLATTATSKSFNFLSGNGKNGSRTFQTATGSSSIEWTNGQITSTGNVTLNLSGSSSLPIGSGDYVFPPSGWEEMTMNFTDVDGFLRTRTFLVRTT